MGTPAVGDVVLVRFPFSDLSAQKLRPAFVAAEAERGDLILCQITSRSWGYGGAIAINGDAALGSGLDRNSYLRPDKLFTADPQLIVRRLGALTPALARRARTATASLFT